MERIDITSEGTEMSHNSLDTAMEFYLRSLHVMDKSEYLDPTRREYIRVARELLKGCPKHPRVEYYERQIKRYEVVMTDDNPVVAGIV